MCKLLGDEAVDSIVQKRTIKETPEFVTVATGGVAATAEEVIDADGVEGVQQLTREVKAAATLRVVERAAPRAVRVSVGDGEVAH